MRISPVRYTHEEFNFYSSGLLAKRLLVPPSLASIVDEAFLALYRSGQKDLPSALPLITGPGENNAKNPDNKGLVVFIHGMNGSSKLGKMLYQKELERQTGNDYEVWVPDLPKKGICSLEEASAPILHAVRKYIETNPGKPVQLIGHSNGGRVAAYLDTQLRDLDVDMRITGIAGAFFGSELMDLGNVTGVSNLYFPESVREEFKTGSTASKELIEAMRKKVTNGSRSYTFYTTKDDIVFPNFTHCLPNIYQKEECVILSGCGHVSIVKKICKKEVKKTVDFLKKHQLMQEVVVTLSEENSTFHTEGLENLATISA